MSVATALPVAPVTNGNEAIERWLEGHGLTYTQRKLKVANIDKQASLRNQARVGAPLNDDTVLMYAAAMENGDLFPPIVVRQMPDTRKYVVIDGNHRVAAMELFGTEDTNAYVVDSPSQAQTIMLTFEANTKHGLPTSMEERLRQAIMLVEHGASQATAAQRLGIPVKRVQDAVYVRRTDRRADQLGINRRWYDLSQSARRAAAGIRNDNVFKAAAELMIVGKFTTPEVTTLSKHINEARTESDQLKVVQNAFDASKDDFKVTAGNRLGISPRLARFNTAVRAITHTQVSDIHKAQMGSDLKARIRLNVVNAQNRLAEISESLQ